MPLEPEKQVALGENLASGSVSYPSLRKAGYPLPQSQPESLRPAKSNLGIRPIVQAIISPSSGTAVLGGRNSRTPKAFLSSVRGSALP
ncbi:MAG: hypothetical protein SNJ78_04005 [Spirochaetales bacterium]